jgi:hypothetical protein
LKLNERRIDKMMRVSIPDPNIPSSFLFAPDEADKVYFVFTPINKNGDLAFLCSLITVRNSNDFLRFEPRYFDKSEMSQFLDVIGKKDVYEKILNQIQEAETVDDVIGYVLSDGENFKVEERDVRKYIKEGYSPLDYSDYTTCALFCYEPRTVLASEEFANASIDELRKILSEGGEDNE